MSEKIAPGDLIEFDDEFGGTDLVGTYESVVSAIGDVEIGQQELFAAKLLLLCATRLGSSDVLDGLIRIARLDLPPLHQNGPS